MKRILALMLVLCALVVTGVSFPDVERGSWYEPAVTRLTEEGILKGYPDGTFGPARPVSRAEFAALTDRCRGAEDNQKGSPYWCGGTLADMAAIMPPAWRGEPLDAAHFEVPITREEAVYLLMGALDPPDLGLGITAQTVQDYDSIDPALRDTVLDAYNAGVTDGVPGVGFSPRGTMTRAQAATMLARAYRRLPFRAELRAVNSWEGGDGAYTQYDLTLTAGTEPVEDWTVTLRGRGFAVTQHWNCQVEARGEALTVTPAEYNTRLEPGGSLTVGMIVRGGALSVYGGGGDSGPQPEPEVPVTVPVGTARPLHVEGTRLADPEGNAVQLRGVSTHGLAWFPQYVSEEAFRTLRDDWGANVVRLAMYTAEYGGYCNGGDRAALKALIDKGVRAADKLGMYVIVDWHILSDGNPAAHQEEAVAFFAEMSRKYAQYDNVLYEICNEPQNSPWKSVIRPYGEKVLATIRANDPDAVVIVGTNTWSQDVEEVTGSRLEDPNVVYAFHFYAATHKDAYRQKITRALDAGVPVFVSECGLCDASGGGGVDAASAKAWFELLNRRGVSFVAWSLCNKNETASLIRPDCAKTSGWTETDLSESGKLFRAAIGGK